MFGLRVPKFYSVTRSFYKVTGGPIWPVSEELRPFYVGTCNVGPYTNQAGYSRLVEDVDVYVVPASDDGDTTVHIRREQGGYVPTSLVGLLTDSNYIMCSNTHRCVIDMLQKMGNITWEKL